MINIISTKLIIWILGLMIYGTIFIMIFPHLPIFMYALAGCGYTFVTHKYVL
jgi:hypothetical protein